MAGHKSCKQKYKIARTNVSNTLDMNFCTIYSIHEQKFLARGWSDFMAKFDEPKASEPCKVDGSSALQPSYCGHIIVFNPTRQTGRLAITRGKHAATMPANPVRRLCETLGYKAAKTQFVQDFKYGSLLGKPSGKARPWQGVFAGLALFLTALACVCFW
jgi:hypothetical protein